MLKLSAVHVTGLINICNIISQVSVSHVHYIIWFFWATFAEDKINSEHVWSHLADRQPEMAHHINSKCLVTGRA